MVRPTGVEPVTLGFGKLESYGHTSNYQYLTSVRHTLKQSQAATKTPEKRESGTFFTTVSTVLHRKSVTTHCTRTSLLCQFNIYSRLSA